MSLHIWRKIYWIAGWKYTSKNDWDEQQRWNKHTVTEEIKKIGKSIEVVDEKDKVFDINTPVDVDIDIVDDILKINTRNNHLLKHSILK